MPTLQVLASNIQYDSSWGIWAELIDGKFAAQSQARYGQRQFENGGLLDEFAFFANGKKIGDHYQYWCGEFELHDYSQWAEIVRKFEAFEDGCEWGGNREEVENWAKDSEDPEVIALVEAAKAEFDSQCFENSDEWLLELIAEMNDDLEARIEY
ncbi:hypothetical protein [Phormidium tenue]|uniref:DUF4375 domain-containing protein n=1 Tax=Phormidium tenue FACHB-1050 TaxID=2692857 RepID=A0ABR8C9H4_9CYAN|nr:hypothetical protein [Phormidium tenue]MBD2316710.1 hypothetical protein [Phormidium tenue FACHB-1050]